MDGPRLRIALEPSRTLFALLCLLHGAAMAAPWASGLPGWLSASLTGLAGAGLAACVRRHREALRAGPWILALEDGGWSLARGAGRHAVELLADTTVWEQLVVLRLRDGAGRVHALALLPDTCTADEFRRLRVALRMSRFRPAGAG